MCLLSNKTAVHTRQCETGELISFNIHTSSGTALMLVNPFLKATKTLLAPHLNAEVQQSNAVSPAPRTITLPVNCGIWLLQAHIPWSQQRKTMNDEIIIMTGLEKNEMKVKEIK